MEINSKKIKEDNESVFGKVIVFEITRYRPIKLSFQMQLNARKFLLKKISKRTSALYIKWIINHLKN